jgi:hypothetical protein
MTQPAWGQNHHVTCCDISAPKGESDDDDPVNTAFDTDINYFRTVAMQSIRSKKKKEDGTEVYEYYGGAARQQDINLFQFYKEHGERMPFVNSVIQDILSQPGASYFPLRRGNTS